MQLIYPQRLRIMTSLCSYMLDFFKPQLCKYSVLEATKQILCRGIIPLFIYTKIENRHRRLYWPVSQINIQRIMQGFLVDGHAILCAISMSIN